MTYRLVQGCMNAIAKIIPQLSDLPDNAVFPEMIEILFVLGFRRHPAHVVLLQLDKERQSDLQPVPRRRIGEPDSVRIRDFATIFQCGHAQGYLPVHRMFSHHGDNLATGLHYRSDYIHQPCVKRQRVHVFRQILHVIEGTPLVRRPDILDMVRLERCKPCRLPP